MTGERCLDGDLRRLQVTHFANQDDVRILTKEAAQEPGEGEVLIHIHLALNQAFDVIFHRIFGGENLGLNVIQLIERGVQRGGLAGTGWTSDDDNAVRLIDERAQFLKVIITQADAVERELNVGAVQYTQHHALTEHGGKHSDAQVNGPGIKAHFHATVLRQAAFRNIELGQDLHAAHQWHRQRLGHRKHFIEHAVNAVAHLELRLKGLHVNVTGLVGNGLHQQVVEQFNHLVVAHGIAERGQVNTGV